MKMTYAEKVYRQVKRSVLSGGYAEAGETDFYKADETVSPWELIKKHERQQS